MDERVIEATYYDMKTIKGRKMIRVEFEVPLTEVNWAKVTEMFGAPLTETDKWVAIALLRQKPKTEAPAETEGRFRKACKMCGLPEFQRFLGVADYESASNEVKDFCQVASREEFDVDERAAQAWDSLLHEYEQQTGRIPEMRG